MTWEKRNVRHYSERIANETGMDLETVHLALMYGWRSICKMIANKQDVRLPKLGRLYFEKKPRERPDKNGVIKNAATVMDGKGVAQQIKQVKADWEID